MPETDFTNPHDASIGGALAQAIGGALAGAATYGSGRDYVSPYLQAQNFQEQRRIQLQERFNTGAFMLQQQPELLPTFQSLGGGDAGQGLSRFAKMDPAVAQGMIERSSKAKDFDQLAEALAGAATSPEEAQSLRDLRGRGLSDVAHLNTVTNAFSRKQQTGIQQQQLQMQQMSQYFQTYSDMLARGMRPSAAFEVLNKSFGAALRGSAEAGTTDMWGVISQSMEAMGESSMQVQAQESLAGDSFVEMSKKAQTDEELRPHIVGGFSKSGKARELAATIGVLEQFEKGSPAEAEFLRRRPDAAAVHGSWRAAGSPSDPYAMVMSGDQSELADQMLAAFPGLTQDTVNKATVQEERRISEQAQRDNAILALDTLQLEFPLLESTLSDLIADLPAESVRVENGKLMLPLAATQSMVNSLMDQTNDAGTMIRVAGQLDANFSPQLVDAYMERGSALLMDFINNQTGPVEQALQGILRESPERMEELSATVREWTIPDEFDFDNPDNFAVRKLEVPSGHKYKANAHQFKEVIRWTQENGGFRATEFQDMPENTHNLTAWHEWLNAPGPNTGVSRHDMLLSASNDYWLSEHGGEDTSFFSFYRSGELTYEFLSQSGVHATLRSNPEEVLGLQMQVDEAFAPRFYDPDLSISSPNLNDPAAAANAVRGLSSIGPMLWRDMLPNSFMVKGTTNQLTSAAQAVIDASANLVEFGQNVQGLGTVGASYAARAQARVERAKGLLAVANTTESQAQQMFMFMSSDPTVFLGDGSGYFTPARVGDPQGDIPMPGQTSKHSLATNEGLKAWSRARTSGDKVEAILQWQRQVVALTGDATSAIPGQLEAMAPVLKDAANRYETMLMAYDEGMLRSLYIGTFGFAPSSDSNETELRQGLVLGSLFRVQIGNPVAMRNARSGIRLAQPQAPGTGTDNSDSLTPFAEVGGRDNPQ